MLKKYKQMNELLYKTSFFFPAETSSNDKKLLKKSLSYASIIQALKCECSCGEKCLEAYSVRTVHALRYRFWSKNRQMRAQWLIQTIKIGKKFGRFLKLRTDDGINVCSKAFLALYKLNKNMLGHCRQLANKDAVALKTKKPRTVSSPVIQCISWFENYVSCSGDRMPDSNSILLPYRTSKLAVYNSYCKANEGNTISRTSFQNIWKWHFPQVKIKQVIVILLFSGLKKTFLHKANAVYKWLKSYFFS